MFSRYFFCSNRRDWAISIIFLLSIYFFVVYDIPTHVPHSPHDDDLFINQALSISSGNWLADKYGELTLVKGPYHSIQIWISSLLGLPPLIGLRSFYAATSVLICSVALRRLPTFLKSLALLCFLFDPILLSSPVGWRLIRQISYVPIELLALGGGIYSLDLIFSIGRNNKDSNLRKKRMLCFSLFITYLCLGLLLITREARIIIVFSAFVYTLLLIYRLWKQKFLVQFNFTKIISVGLVLILAFNGPIFAVKALNYVNYDLAISNEFEEGKFKSFYQNLASVRLVNDDYKPFIPITQDTIDAIISLSGTNQLGSTLFNINLMWKKYGCQVNRDWCGEYAGGWFLWALRESIFKTSNITSPRSFQEYISVLNSELLQVCNSNSTILSCSRSNFGYLPYPSRWASENQSLLIIIFDAAKNLFSWWISPNPFAFVPNVVTPHHQQAEMMNIRLFQNYTPEEISGFNQRIKSFNEIGIFLRKSLLFSFVIIFLINLFIRPRLSLFCFSDPGLIYILTMFLAVFAVLVLIMVTSFPSYAYLSLISPVGTLFIWRYYDRLAYNTK